MANNRYVLKMFKRRFTVNCISVLIKFNITSTTIITLDKKFNQNKSTDDKPITFSCTYTILSYYGCKIFLMELNLFRVIKTNALLQANSNGLSNKS